jgi:hypothetical protein
MLRRSKYCEVFFDDKYDFYRAFDLRVSRCSLLSKKKPPAWKAGGGL